MIATTLERVFSKITDILPEKITIRPELIFNKFSFTTPPTRPIDMEVWSAVVRGLVNQKLLAMGYRAPDIRFDEYSLHLQRFSTVTLCVAKAGGW